MSVAKGKGPIFDPGMCRCCGSLKRCRVLNVEYQCMGQKEVYSDMIMVCFGLLLSHLDDQPSARLVCATCVARLRDAAAFRAQVLRCEAAFLQLRMGETEAADQQARLDASALLEVEIKPEPPDGSELGDPPDLGSPGADPGDPPDPDDPGEPDLCTDPDRGLGEHIVNEAIEKKRVMCESSDSDDAPLKRRKRRAGGRAPAKQPPKPVDADLPMHKVQQIMRERDPSYMIDSNVVTIVECSYVCPFKCRHNHLLCYYCGANFSDPILLRDHTTSEHHPKKFKVIEHKKMIKMDLTRIDCRLCSEKISDIEEFKRHITSIHKKKYYFNSKDLILPFRLTSNEQQCALCDEVFPYFHALNKHMNKHFSNYVCETCGLGFVDKGRFVMHQQRHEEGDFPCDTCGKIFKAQYNRDLHIDRVHNKRGRVFCPKCDAKLMSYTQKLKHLVEVHGDAPLSFPCSACERVFGTRRTLTIHRRKDHLKDYRYECHFCGQKFFTRFALNNHMPTHTRERNFKCKVCEKTYPRLKTLKDHMRIHTNDRRYRCHVCGQAFIQNCSLKGHMKSQHSEYG